tara:strand:+ start:260852 stop:261919 length:1068 start_codon:yes stop_codon:yes gene_type:complete
MTANTQDIEKAASRDATSWLVLLQDDPDDAELRGDFEKWLNRSPVNQTAWQAMQHASNAMDMATPVHADKWTPLLENVRRADRAKSIRDRAFRFRRKQADRLARKPFWSAGFGRRATFGFAGLGVAACLVAAIVGPNILRDLQSDYMTGTAQTRTITLEDGSSVTLAPESAITVTYNADVRNVRLLDGEAFFEVSPNPERPFRVAAKGVNTTVLGTAFDVLRNDDGVDVSVEHGKVRVDYINDGLPLVAETLGAGQSLRIDWSGSYERGKRPANHVAAWRQNQIVARYEPFGAVVDQLRRHYAGKIIVLGDELATKPVTGVYNLADPLEALYGIARAQNAVLWQVSPWLVIVSNS